MSKVIRMLKITKLSGNSEWFNKILYKSKVNKAYKKLIKFIIITIACLHIGGCLWYFTAEIYDLNQETWV